MRFEWLRDCAGWLAQLDRGEYPPVVNNLRPEADHPERCNIVVDLGRVRRVLLRIAAPPASGRVDQVRRIVHHLRRRADRSLNDSPRALRIMRHAKALPHQPTLPLPRFSRAERRRSFRQPKTTTNVLHSCRRNLSGPREVPEALKTSQRQHERQEVPIRPHSRPCPRHIVLGWAHQSELPGRHQPPRIHSGRFWNTSR
jgi:hypothetical protein